MIAIGLVVGLVGLRAHRPVPVKVAAHTVFEGPEVTLAGRIEPQSTEQVDAPVAGILEAWFVDEGQEVYQDQLVGRIQNANLDDVVQKTQAAFDQAELRVAQTDAQSVNAKLELSRAAADQVRVHNELDRIEKIYQRYKMLMDADAIARLTFEKTESDYKVANTEAAARDASAEEAQKRELAAERDLDESKSTRTKAADELAKAKDATAVCDLHSPADGVVLARDVHQGLQVEQSAKALLTVATDLTNLRVSLAPGAPVLARIRTGQHAFIHTGDEDFTGEVTEIRGADVIVDFTIPAPVAKLGMAAQVRIVF